MLAPGESSSAGAATGNGTPPRGQNDGVREDSPGAVTSPAPAPRGLSFRWSWKRIARAGVVAGLIVSVAQIWKLATREASVVAELSALTESSDQPGWTDVRDRNVSLRHGDHIWLQASTQSGPHKYILFINGDGSAELLGFERFQDKARPTWSIEDGRDHRPSATFLLICAEDELAPAEQKELEIRVERAIDRALREPNETLDLQDSASKLRWTTDTWQRLVTPGARQPSAPPLHWPDAVLAEIRALEPAVGRLAVSGWTFNVATDSVRRISKKDGRP